MARETIPADQRYDSLISPFKSIKHFTETAHETLLREESEVLDGTSFQRLDNTHYQRGTQTLRVGGLHLIAGRTTPVQCSSSSANFSCFFAMPLIGGFTTKDGSLYDEVSPGDIYLNQNYYGTSRMGYLSSLFIALDLQQLSRTMLSISGGQSLAELPTSVVIKGKRRSSEIMGTSKLWSLISFIDQLHGDDTHIPSCLGLDEQFYRLLSLSLLETAGKWDQIKRHWATPAANWTNPLDDLVDYIRTNAHQNLTLTDLEERSHYSARHLQNLFKEKLNCTPMQFVRRQRLSNAMEKLQTADWDDSVTSIARQCGYRSASNFSHDFQQQFGVSPSTVLRSARRLIRTAQPIRGMRTS